MIAGLKILLLAGTREAREIAQELTEHDVVASLAGVTRSPGFLAGQVRRGGFGGVAGLISHLKSDGYDLVIDATHPFACVMTANAIAACRATGTPLLHVLRPAWTPGTGDDWQGFADLDAAAAALPAGARVFLATGSRSLAHFTPRCDVWFLARVIDAPGRIFFASGRLVTGRPPFPVEHEMNLMRSADVSHMVARNAGGADGTAKLVAAQRLGVQVFLVRRPPPPSGHVVASVDGALAHVEQVAGRGGKWSGG